NCGHAVLAYQGYLKGYTFAHDAIADVKLLAQLQAVWQESIAGLVAQYGVPVEWLASLADDLPRRFANRALGDTLFRLGRDPVRKLGPTDRLVAPARLAQKAGVTPTALASGIAAALRFDPSQDPIAVALQKQLAAQGIDAVLENICHIAPHEPLAALVRQNYQDR
ncbi:MAG: mannitol-1-phosphate 5-dehydrogenase, partial [Anaerolineae bacterium]|nr:mannitol-1-phosphate 5-dehydrogenase [Anaerolineae bacterium]